YAVAERFKGRNMTGIPGFYKKEGNWRLNLNDWHSGYLVPVRDVRGRIEGFQIRRAEVKPDEPRYVWLSSSNKDEGCSSGAPIHYRNPEQARRTGQVIITEGALKADIASHLLGGNAVVAVAGVHSFQEDFGQRLKAQMPELRQAVIAFDADSGRNPVVQQAPDRLGESLKAAGLDVREMRWTEQKGKGIDDYLLKDPSHQAEVKTFLKESLESIEHGHTSAQQRHEQGSPKREQQTGFVLGL